MAKDLSTSVLSVPVGGTPTTTTVPCILSYSSDPTVGSGVAAPVGSLGIRTDSPSAYVKAGSGNTAWTLIGFAPGTFSTVALTGNITPTTLSGTVNDYAPSGIAGAAIIRQAVASGGATLTGLNAGAQQSNGAFVVFENLGSGDLALEHQAGSSAANQFVLPGNIGLTIPPNGAFICIYDATSSKWRVIAAGGTPSTIASGDGAAWYGTGVDGNLVFDGSSTVTGFSGLSLTPTSGVYTLTRDISANSMSVSSGAAVKCNGFRLFVLNKLACDGQIHGNGNSGSAATSTLGGVAGVGGSASILFQGVSGGNGGGPDAGSGGTPSAGSAATGTTHFGATAGIVNAGASGVSLQGGGGGTNNIGSTGGTVGPLPVPSGVSADHFWTLTQAIQGRNGVGTVLGGGSGGGGGRGGGLGGAGGGGGGGASAATIVVAARRIVGSGSIQARGGDGGSGFLNGGGGGAGAGGVMVIVTDSAFPLGVALDVSGGTGGARGGNPNTTAGGNGGLGLIYKFNPQN
ncbi:MAG: hypothetical protein ABI867_15300 [Kofleriaceae bacterium]